MTTVRCWRGPRWYATAAIPHIPNHEKESTMTANDATREEIAIRRGRIAAIDIAKAVHDEQPEDADRIYRREIELGMGDLLHAGATSVLLTLARGFAEARDVPVEAVLEHLWQNEAGTLTTLSEINNLPTTNEKGTTP